jgi:hypothetical protein
MCAMAAPLMQALYASEALNSWPLQVAKMKNGANAIMFGKSTKKVRAAA